MWRSSRFKHAHALDLAQGFVHVGSHLLALLWPARGSARCPPAPARLRSRSGGNCRPALPIHCGSSPPPPRACGRPQSMTLAAMAAMLRRTAQQDAALTGGQCLGGLQGERAKMTDCPCTLAAPLGAVGVRTVLDDDQLVLFSQVHDGVHIGHLVPRWTGMMALVLGVMALAAALGSSSRCSGPHPR